MGIGLGTGYLSPVKTLMLWFKDKKGLATGLAVAGFGAAKAIATPIMQSILNAFDNNPAPMFFIMGGVYCVMMFVGHLLLRKPSDWVEQHAEGGIKEFFATLGKNFKTSFSNKTFIGIWLMFYINITCGLAIISQEKMIVKCVGLGAAAGIISTISALFNAGGRLGFSAWADKLKDRNTIYKLIFTLSIVSTLIVLLTKGIANGAGNTALIIFVLALIFIVNAGYGGGFSNVPTLLSDHYGMGNISAIHGITLSAWAFAGLTGNQMASFIVNHVGEFTEISGVKANPTGYQTVLIVTTILYAVAMCLSCFLVRPMSKKNA
jgi:OFA family oxalate/formate antiporter-like MFS transporter